MINGRSKNPITQRKREWREMPLDNLREEIRKQRKMIMALEVNYRGTSEGGGNNRMARGKEESQYMPDLGTEKKNLARMLTILKERLRKGEIRTPAIGG